MDLTWGIAAIMAVSFSMAAAIIIGLIIHNRRIRASELKFRTLFQNVFDALFLIDSAGNIVDVNNSACVLSGYSRKELKKRRIVNLVPAEISSALRGKKGKIKVGELVYFGEAILKNKDHKEIYVEVGGIRIMMKDEEMTLASLRDIHARKMAEMELERKNIALKEVLSHIEMEKRSFKNEIALLVEDKLLPSLQRIVQNNGNGNSKYYRVLEENLQRLASYSEPYFKSHSKLSPRELEVCNMIKNGATNKDIAEKLNLSLKTVNKHRERIRKKLSISNKNINLTSFLKQL